MRGLHHLMFEMSDMDDVGLTYDQLSAFDIPIAMTPGRHPNDRMFAFCCRVPRGFEIEVGYGGRLIECEADWEVKTYHGFSEWGHKRAPIGRPSTLEPA